MKGTKIALRCALACFIGAAALASGAAQVDDSVANLPAPAEEDVSNRYRGVGAQHLYSVYPERIYKGQLPPLLYAIAITETEIDEHGNVLSTVVVREPAAAKDVGPWVVSLIKAASPFPKPGSAGRTRYRDIWLVDESYTFQLDTLTEGQR